MIKNPDMNMEMIEAVAESYRITESFKKTAAELKISTSKVRKALLTAGAWTNETADEIQALRSEHEDWSDQAIADHPLISLITGQMYTPYKIGPYDGVGDSKDRMSEYRARNRKRVTEKDKNRQEVGDMITQEMKKNTDNSWYEKIQQEAKEKGLPFAYIRHNDDPDAMPYVDDQFFLDYRFVEPAHDQDRHPKIRAMKIRLSVDTERMDASELEMIEREYGVKKGWTRDLVVPSYIPLHFLHYVIQRAFGFENVEDHIFQLDPDQFNAITEGELRSYCRLCGVLFRFPFGNDEELYWDDDYDGKKSIKTWLKEKYEGCWDTDAGTGYKYVDNQYRIWQWLGDKVTDFHKFIPAFDSDDCEKELLRLGAPEAYSIGGLDECGVDEANELAGQKTQFPVNNILECLALDDLLASDAEEIDLWRFEDDLEMAESELLENLVTLEEAREKMKEAQKLYKSLERRMKSGLWDEDVLLVKRWRETARNAAQLFVMAGGGADVPEPFADHIDYLYDFGAPKGQGMNGDAKWRIRIQLLEEYYDNSIYYSRNYTAVDANGVSFEKDPDHEAEWADRLHEMCHWKEELEITDSRGRWIRPSDIREMKIKLREEQELLPEERVRIEEDRKQRGEWRREMGYEHEREEVIDDEIYRAVRIAMLDRMPVCIGKEGTEPGEGYPDEKIRNTSIENLV